VSYEEEDTHYSLSTITRSIADYFTAVVFALVSSRRALKPSHMALLAQFTI